MDRQQSSIVSSVTPLAIDQDHPYYIGTSDNSGVLLISLILVGPADYFSWVWSLRMALDGTEVAPEASDPSFCSFAASKCARSWIDSQSSFC
ncbi:hypothetical protein LINPERHAP1_LOCUS19669 [Linum perenne]